ncbi:hypothetical protein [Deinococcus marmoris]|uniref:hypothetical protein n=1 Tax=Deinococcus marmoris TaxID=249408 RepID=UPI00096AC07A|nr:hypothetical protein [Deinococcus marmoris]
MSSSSTNALNIAAQTIKLILNREGATLATLRDQLTQLQQVVSQLPMTICWPDDFGVTSTALARYMELRTIIQHQWPELGFYDMASLSNEITDDTSEVGDDLDNLTDLVKDLSEAAHLAATDLTGGLSWLRFTADTHWGDHIDDLVRHLGFVITNGAPPEQS